MKSKRLLLLLPLLCALPILSGCMAGVVNPLEKAEATPVPGLNMRLYAASASNTNVDEIQATLYYRFLNQPMLAAETRTLTVPRDESKEFAIVKALLEGPSAGHSELTRLFPDSVVVESVTPRDKLLFVTFNEALLTDDVVFTNRAQQDQWIAEAPLRRKLTIQSLVASITESFPYTGVQILVHQSNQAQASFRLDNAYFLSGAVGLSEPQRRDESLLLTPENTAKRLLEAWQSNDSETLYVFLSSVDHGEPKPSFAEAALALDSLAPLTDFAVLGGGSVSANGQSAVVTVNLTVLHEGGKVLWEAYPLPLVRENNVWKIRYSELDHLLTL